MKVPANVLKLYKKGSESNRFKKKSLQFYFTTLSFPWCTGIMFGLKKKITHKKDKQGQRSSSCCKQKKTHQEAKPLPRF